MKVIGTFFSVTAVAFTAFILVHSIVDSYDSKAHQANLAADKERSELRETYCRINPELCDDDGFPLDRDAPERYARRRMPERLQAIDRYHQIAADKTRTADRAQFVSNAIALFWLLSLPAFVVAGVSGRARTRGQRIGLVVVALSPACLARYYFWHGRMSGVFASPDFLACLILAGAGVLLFLRVPQRLFSWISGGEKD